ncbi:MAG: hypothetical protein K0R31_271 [Clostridiales bacterium]|nr:hypothetical protein [Clostridiales bacterium]
MFNSRDKVITKVLNPLEATEGSLIEFNIGDLKDTGMYRFDKIIEFDFGNKAYSRYLIYSKAESSEYVLEVFPSNGQLETYIYKLYDTVPFSEDFLDVAGQRFFTTPEDAEYQRCIMPDNDEKIDGLKGKVKIYDIEAGVIEKEYGIRVWDYQRDAEGTTEFLNIEMNEETGVFRIFTGEIIESIFYKFYQTSKAD